MAVLLIIIPLQFRWMKLYFWEIHLKYCALEVKGINLFRACLETPQQLILEKKSIIFQADYYKDEWDVDVFPHAVQPQTAVL